MADNEEERDIRWLWRQNKLPEFFLGNGGTNGLLVDFARACGEYYRLKKLSEDEKCG